MGDRFYSLALSPGGLFQMKSEENFKRLQKQMREGGVILVRKISIGLTRFRSERHYQNRGYDFMEVEDEDKGY